MKLAVKLLLVIRRHVFEDRQLTNVGSRCRTSRLTLNGSPKPLLPNITATSESETASLFINRLADLFNVLAEIQLSLIDAATSFIDARTVKGGSLGSRGCINTSRQTRTGPPIIKDIYSQRK